MTRVFSAWLLVLLAARAGSADNRLGDDALIKSVSLNGVTIRFYKPVREAERSTFGDGTKNVDQLSTPDHVIAVSEDTLYMDNCSYGRVSRTDDVLIRGAHVMINGDRTLSTPVIDAATLGRLWLRPTVEANHNGRQFLPYLPVER